MEPRRISVLHFSNATARGGAQEHILSLLRSLDRGRFQAHFACDPAIAADMKRELPGDVPVIPVRLRTPGDVSGAFALGRELRGRRIGILHSHEFSSSRLASPIGRLCGVPAVIETPHLREHWRRGPIKGSFAIDRLVGRFVDYYIAVSEANARYLVDEKRLPAKKVVTIQNGCELSKFQAPEGARGAARAEIGLSEEHLLLLVVARLEEQKGHRVLLDAMPRIVAAFPRARLVCAGDGACRAGLEAQTAALGLHGCVTFLGFRADVARWLAAADVVVLPSLFEGLPLSAVEALAAGRAMVATAVDGTPEVVLHGRTGLVVPPGDATALAAAVCTLLADAGLRAHLGAAGRRWVAERFALSRQVRETEALYERAAAHIAARPAPIPERAYVSRA